MPSPLVLVRHGESDWNVAHLVQGQDDRARLTDHGRAQARDAAEHLADDTFDLILSSDLARATETADIISSRLAVEVRSEPLLRERNFGEFEGRPADALHTGVTGIDPEQSVLVDPDARPPGGESFREMVARAHDLLARVDGELGGVRLLLVTHGGMVRAIRAAVDGRDLTDLPWEPVGNASVWRVAR